MLRDLEQHIHSLGIRSYGISLTTLEDVFLRYCDQKNQCLRMIEKLFAESA
jgi:hypothetical protein